MQHQDILTLVYSGIDEINRQLPAASRLPKELDTILLGDGGTLDSLSLINFIVTFEEALEQAHGVRYDLLEEDVLGDPSGPLQSVRSLVGYIQQRRNQNA